MHNEVNIPSKKWKCSILHKRCPFFSAEQTVRRWTSLGGLVLPAKIVAKFSVKVKVFRWWKTTKWSWLAPVTNQPSTSLAGKECVERTEEYWLQNWVCALFLLATLHTSWTVWAMASDTMLRRPEALCKTRDTYWGDEIKWCLDLENEVSCGTLAWKVSVWEDRHLPVQRRH